MLRVAIVDDLAQDRQELKKAAEAELSALGAEAVCLCFPDAAAFLRAHEQEPFRLVFLDIRMGEMDGITLSRTLRQTDPELLIVFVSSSREYAFDAFPVHPFDYLVKPWTAERLRGVLAEAARVLLRAETEVEIRVPHASMKVPLDRISAVAAQGHAIEITMTGGQKIRSIMTFSELSALLEKDERFLPLNRGVLINMDHVLTLQGETLRMKTGESYPFRTRGRSSLVSRFTQYQIARMRRGIRE